MLQKRCTKLTAVVKKVKLVAPEKCFEHEKTATSSKKDFGEMMAQLKDKFRKTDKRSEKIKLLTVIPKSWSIRKTATLFNTSYLIANRAKHLVKEKGIQFVEAFYSIL